MQTLRRTQALAHTQTAVKDPAYATKTSIELSLCCHHHSSLTTITKEITFPFGAYNHTQI